MAVSRKLVWDVESAPSNPSGSRVVSQSINGRDVYLFVSIWVLVARAVSRAVGLTCIRTGP